MSKPITVKEFFAHFPNDESCLDHLMKIRFGEKLDCPKCGKHGKFHRLGKERAYSCQWCGHHIHPTVGTPMERSRTSLQHWFYAMLLFAVSRHGVSGKELQRLLGCTYKTAWRMRHEIRKYMASLEGNGPLDGDVEAVETYIGQRKDKRERGAKGKVIIFCTQDHDSNLISKIAPKVCAMTLKSEI